MRASETAEFEAFVSARAAALRRTAYLLCGDWHQAEDIVQIGLTKLYLAWRRVEKRDGLDAYARQIVVRCALDERRRGWRRERPTDAVPELPVRDAGSDDRETLLAALATVPQQQRAVLVLRYWEDVSIAETARILGITEGAVKSASSRGLENLRRSLPELTLNGAEED
jgi:RNA polymerase sigma-70 factor (sigma-E family)